MAIWALFASIAYQAYNDEWDKSAVFGTNVASLIERDIARNIELYDMSIKSAGINIAETGIRSLSPDLQRRFVFDGSAAASDLGSILVLDRNGKVVMESRGLIKPGVDFSDRENFIAQRDGTDQTQPFVSHPFKSRINSKMGIGFSRRRNAPDGSFDGAVVGMMGLGYFAQLFEAAHLPPDSTITLVHRDGTILMREPERPGTIGRNLKPDTMFAQGNPPDAGVFVRQSIVDGLQRFFAFKQVSSLPIYTVVGLSTHEFQRRWYWNMQLIGFGFVVLSGIVVLLGHLLRRELDRRTEAERELAKLAATDSLTQLANRRHFDEVFDAEWRRATRNATSIALLMVDSDLFKAFNDTYGHMDGDDALRAIAGILRLHIKRAGDLVARFGGEEFVVLLPGTDIEGAAGTAQAIRQAVAALDMPHRGSPFGRLTVSIGIASRRPAAKESSSLLIEAADVALYAAKNSGRNCVMSASSAAASVPVASRAA